MRRALGPIRCDAAGFEALSSLAQAVEGLVFDKLVLDMSGVTWFDADMSAPLGALLHRTQKEFNEVELVGFPRDVEAILCRNGFLSQYGGQKLPDSFGTTVPYLHLALGDGRYFAEYVDQKLMQNPSIPRMSDGLRKKFLESVFELFSNSQVHSKSVAGVFSCGQHFPKKQRLIFTVSDLGIGIRQNVELFTDQTFTDVDAIVWATHERNTTRTGPVPGGLGLKLLKEFVGLNGGRLQIVSGTGYWGLSGRTEEVKTLPAPLPGVTVSIEINTADEASYKLSTEIDAGDVF